MSEKCYGDRNKKDKAWAEVAAEMGTNGMYFVNLVAVCRIYMLNK